ncbi:MAG TPA: DinB family protein [Candidatus Acidoferrales bacterium]|nr:DinB family protein [Candidatus Acidoferrales bacterium]
MNETPLRRQLAALIAWGDAHADWPEALAGLPPRLRGARPPGLPHSPWELLEHVRIAQWDILEFSRNPKHISPEFPRGYWPKSAAPSSPAAWTNSVKTFLRGRKAFQQLVSNPKTDLFARIPHGSGQTILREILLAADHNSYHLGQFILVRRLLGAWR